MKVRIWGCRGSLPTPGPNTVRYGGNTTCVEVRLSDDSLIIFDAGSGIKGLGEQLVKQGATRDIYLFLTHSHWDHLMGFPFFAPAYLPQFKIFVRGGPRAKASLKNFLEHQMEPPYFPVPFNLMKAKFDFTHGPPEKRVVSNAEVFPIPVSHPNGAYGFKVLEGDKTLVFLPDNELDFHHEGGLATEEYVEFCRDADLLLHDSQYLDAEYPNRRGWGHSSLSAVVGLASAAKVKRLGFFHHDPGRKDDDMDKFFEEGRQKVAAISAETECFACREGMEISL